MKKSSTLFAHALLVALMGCLLSAVSLFSLSVVSRIQDRFQSGKFSMNAVMERTGIRSDNDCNTEREKMLFGALNMTNEQCVFSCVALQKGGLAVLVGGLAFILYGVSGIRLVIALRKQINEQEEGSHISNVKRA